MANPKLQIVIDAKDNASRKMDDLNDNVKKTGISFTKMAAVGAAAIAVLATVTGKIIKEFADFEKSMSAVKAITGTTGDEFSTLNDLAKKMGRTTVFSAKEAAEGMKFLGMAGFTAADISESLKGTLDLAAAGGLDLGTAADIASNVLTGFNKDASEMNKVVDIMAETVTSANTNIVEMGEAMKFFAPIASSLGIDVSEAAALVGMLGNAGLKGGIATREFASSLGRLAAPTDKMIDGLDAMNVNVFDVNGSFVGMGELLGQIEEGTKGMTDQQKQAAISMAFGSGSIKVMNSLLSAGSEEFIAYTDQLENSEGVAEKMANTMIDNLAGSFTLAKSALSGLMIELGESPAAGLRGIIDGATTAINILTDAVEANGGLFGFLQEQVNSVMTFIEENTGLITIMKTSWENVATVFREHLLPRLKELWDALTPLKPFLKVFAEVIGILLLGAFIALVKLIEVSVIVAIEILTGIIEWAVEKVNSFKSAWDDIIEVLAKVITWIDKVIGKIKEMNFLNGAKNFIGGILGFGGGKADGGEVSNKRTYMVGENGPEMFIPQTSGNIIPNHKLQGGGTTLIVNVGGNVTSERDLVDVIGDALTKKMQFNQAMAG